MCHFVNESKDDIVAKYCKEGLVAKEIRERRFP